jgi:Bacterial regulatory proteins, lacI family
VSRKPMSLKKLAEHLGLSPATVSLVINRSIVADSIPQETKDRIFAAAGKFKYRPNFLARTLRSQRSFTIGVIVPEVSDGYSSSVMRGGAAPDGHDSGAAAWQITEVVHVQANRAWKALFGGVFLGSPPNSGQRLGARTDS